MREIEFRAKKKTPYGDKWVEGYYALLDGEHVIIMPHSTSYEEALKENRVIPTISVNHEIDINTLGQYTGLKDKNGKKIYEGDILEWEDGFGIHNDIVVWDEYEWALQYGQEQKWIRSIFITYYDAEVIGNIYDNPELIDKSK